MREVSFLVLDLGILSIDFLLITKIKFIVSNSITIVFQSVSVSIYSNGYEPKVFFHELAGKTLFLTKAITSVSTIMEDLDNSR